MAKNPERRDLSKRRRKDAPRAQCTAHKKNGERCKRPPILGGSVCPTHGGSAPQVREAARRRLLAASDWLMAELLKIAKSGESEGVRLAAVRDALDRAGFGAQQKVHVDAVVSKWEEMLNDEDDATVVITFGDDTDTEPDTEAWVDEEPEEELLAAPVRRALPSDPTPDEALQGVVHDPPRRPVPPHVRDALRRSGYEV